MRVFSLPAACSCGLLEAESHGTRQPVSHSQMDMHSSDDHTCFTHTSRQHLLVSRPVGLPSAATSVAHTVWLTSTLHVCPCTHVSW